jgi:uncharacterized protein (DUF427 family)
MLTIMRPQPDPAGPGQESAWDYQRPPRLERTSRHLVVVLAGVTVADTTRAWRVLETSHPPVYYLPPDDIAMDCLSGTGKTTFCEFKGRATYATVSAGDRTEVDAAWTYPEPVVAFTELAGHFGFYPGRMDSCTVDGEVVRAQPGGFYGGWITDDVVGPFKGESGSWNW